MLNIITSIVLVSTVITDGIPRSVSSSPVKYLYSLVSGTGDPIRDTCFRVFDSDRESYTVKYKFLHLTNTVCKQNVYISGIEILPLMLKAGIDLFKFE